jgi:type IV pilus assembly protein PilA
MSRPSSSRVSRGGFTLIELLIVVVIIGILASIAIAKYHNSKEQSYIASMREDIRNLATAQEAYYFDHNGVYAPSIASLGTAFKPSETNTVSISGATASSWRATATSSMTPVKCRLATNTTKSYDSQVICK